MPPESAGGVAGAVPTPPSVPVSTGGVVGAGVTVSVGVVAGGVIAVSPLLEAVESAPSSVEVVFSPIASASPQASKPTFLAAFVTAASASSICGSRSATAVVSPRSEAVTRSLSSVAWSCRARRNLSTSSVPSAGGGSVWICSSAPWTARASSIAACSVSAVSISAIAVFVSRQIESAWSM